ncbi:hypothetical protein K435DRAFT_802772 [Dendrothele bispora CBS 962.96]|uniref:Uncharacterized protein n=1 Tax=Dendrothele bispora (strain CBS 962.96) TaxID=1314807 RepID=A0A4S8LJP2_DENBC|nr:hypothetical protein K435DRAFT_802772 [Dendrothele bispora CBS 962.96]
MDNWPSNSINQSTPEVVPRLSQDCLKTVSRLSQDYPRTIPGLSQDCPRSIPGLPQDCPRTMLRLPQDYPETTKRLLKGARDFWSEGAGAMAHLTAMVPQGCQGRPSIENATRRKLGGIDHGEFNCFFLGGGVPSNYDSNGISTTGCYKSKGGFESNYKSNHISSKGRGADLNRCHVKASQKIFLEQPDKNCQIYS